MEIVVKAPNQNVAQKNIIVTQQISTELKRLIMENVDSQGSIDDLTKKMNNTIGNGLKDIKNVDLREELRSAFVVSARKWHYDYTQSTQIFKRAFINQAIRIGKEKLIGLDIRNAMIGNATEVIDRFRPYLISGRGRAIIADYEEKMVTSVKALSAEPTMVIRREGQKAYQMPARLRAEIAARYEATQDDLRKLKENNVKYVWTSSHANCSERCKKYQGRLFSTDENDKQGVIDGVPYTYLQDALDDNDGNSIIEGYNCRHRLIEYRKGSKAPEDFSDAEIRREYAIDQRQRYYENEIRQKKIEEALLRQAGLKEQAEALKKQHRKMMKQYEIYSVERERPFYRFRTIVTKDEVRPFENISIDEIAS